MRTWIDQLLAVAAVVLLTGCGAPRHALESPAKKSASRAPIEDLSTKDANLLQQLAPNRVCGRRAEEECSVAAIHTFAAHELPFNPQIQGRRESLDSLPFYAVILESQPAAPDDGDPSTGIRPTRPCGGFFPEVDRLDAQLHFGQNRVFASRHGCAESSVVYAGISPTENILAVFAGDTEAEARAVLAVAASRWSTAKLVRTQVQLLTFN